MSSALPVVDLACRILQLINFSTKILQEDNIICSKTDDITPEDSDVLQSLIDILARLSLGISKNEKERLSAELKSGKLGDACRQLTKLGKESKELTHSLFEALLAAQAICLPGDARWKTTRDALLVVWKEKDVSTFLRRLQALRKQVDAAFLHALRQFFEKSSDEGLTPPESGSKQPYQSKWQLDLLEAVQVNDWRTKSKEDVESFSKQVIDKLISADQAKQFRGGIFTALHFPQQDDRLHSISTPLKGSFGWIWDSRHQKGGSFIEWLGNTEGRNVFWITGKPGSGKSTLMKYLFRNERLFEWLENWSGDAPGILTGFFLWNCGTKLQKSALGLLRSLVYETLQDLIYGPLEVDPQIVQELFSSRWRQFQSYGGGLHDFTFLELRQCFEILISDPSKNFLFMIDGLDELDDPPGELFDLIFRAVRRQNVKICLSSRTTPFFQQAFADGPSLTLEQWTRRSTLSYVLRTFDENDTMFNIASEESDGTAERAIINTIVDKSSGVFLWVVLATEFLIQCTSSTDDVTLIRERVDALPPDLDMFLSHVFNSLDAKDREQAYRLFRLVDAHGYPSLLPLCFANEADSTSSVAAEVRPLSYSELIPRMEEIRNIIKFKCRGFLTIFDASPAQGGTEDTAELSSFKVNYTHRCIRDFMRSETRRSSIRELHALEGLNTDENWANAGLWMLKTLPAGEQTMLIWTHIADSIEYALRLEQANKKVRFTYLEEVAHVITMHKHLIPLMDFPPGPSVETFLDIAVWLNLSGYIAVIAKRVERKELRHAFEYRKEMRNRLHFGGAQKWLGGRRTLSQVYNSTAPELDSLLEYYTKAVRIGTPKPSIEIPEWV